MAKDDQNIYWIKTGETFAGRKTGEDITDFFVDKKGAPIQEERLEKLKKDGYVSVEQPASIEEASEIELNSLRKTITDQTDKIVDLENELTNIPKNVTAARKQIKELKSELVEKDIEIEALTKPGGK